MGSIWLGGRFMAMRRARDTAIVLVRCSWQPTQDIVSPGSTVQKLCMCLTDMLSASRATKKRLRMAGTSKWAEPSGSTGTVPRTRSSVKVPPNVMGTILPV